MKPFFTVIIPTLNEENYIGRLLVDLTKQKYTDFEVIVADAKSEDKTISEVRKFKTSLTISKILTIPERNVSKQRNMGSTYAKGSYLVFLDADSQVGIYFLKKLYLYIKSHGGLVLLPALAIVKQDPQMMMALDFSNAFVALLNKIGRPMSSGGSMIIERNFFSHIHGFPENVPMSEDHLLVQNAFKHGVIARFLSHVKVKISLRRYKREGKLEVFFKYIKSALYFLAKGKVDKKIIEYEMGGHLYNKQSQNALQRFLKVKPQLLLKNFNKNMKSIIRGLDL